jgi:hypothetical protein
MVAVLGCVCGNQHSAMPKTWSLYLLFASAFAICGKLTLRAWSRRNEPATSKTTGPTEGSAIASGYIVSSYAASIAWMAAVLCASALKYRHFLDHAPHVGNIIWFVSFFGTVILVANFIPFFVMRSLSGLFFKPSKLACLSSGLFLGVAWGVLMSGVFIKGAFDGTLFSAFSFSGLIGSYAYWFVAERRVIDGKRFMPRTRETADVE